ncbi:MAG: hypothetical protein M3P18_25695 [Actinomycetota bacterium]|nr:hypothetical protein [Actinomycetota bacterium]
MSWVVLALAVLLGAPACRQAEASKRTTVATGSVLPRIKALEGAVQQVDARQTHLAHLAGKAAARIHSLRARLARALAMAGHLKARLDAVGAAAAAAASRADAAQARAAELAAQLSVLEKRFDYHLTHDPGGQ